MQIRVTIETNSGKYGSLAEVETHDDANTVGQMVADTLHGLLAPRGDTLPELENTPGYVDAELSAEELSLVTSYRASLAQLGKPAEMFDSTVMLLPRAAQRATIADVVGGDHTTANAEELRQRNGLTHPVANVKGDLE